MRVLIIGAGIAGVTTAYHLHRYGTEVTVVDRESGSGLECSYANGGGLTASVPEPWNAPGIHKVLFQSLGKKDAPILLRMRALPGILPWGIRFLLSSRRDVFINNVKRNSLLANYSLSLIKEIQEEVNIDFHYSGSGTLLVFRDQVALDAYLEHADFLENECGVESQPLDQSKLIAQEPSLQPIREKLTGAIFFPEDASGNCYLFCSRLAEALENNGIKFRYSTNVTNIVPGNSNISAELANGETVRADAIVLATGAYSPHLLRPLGIRLPVYPAKGYSLTLPMNGWNKRPRHLIGDMSLHAGVVPLGDEILRVAGTAEFTGYDKSIPQERVGNLIGLVKAIFPEFAESVDSSAIDPWTGFRPMSADGVPVLGKTGIEGLYLNTGQGHLGWTMSAASSRIVADIVMGKTPVCDTTHYSINRF